MGDDLDADLERISAVVRETYGLNGKAKGPRLKWLTLADLTAPLPAVQWVCEPLRIAPGAVTMFAGYGYSGKTAAAQSLVSSMVHGRDVFGVWRIERGIAAHADYEQGRRLTVERYQRLARAMRIDDSWSDSRELRVVPLPEIYLDDKKAYDEYCWLCDGARLLIVDSFRAGVPSIDENDSKARIFLDMLARVSERQGCACIVIHHFNKESGDSRGGAQRLRGTGAIFDACQTVWSFVATEGEPVVNVSILKDRLTGLKDETFGIEFSDVMDKRGLVVAHREAMQVRRPSALERVRSDVLTFIETNPDCTTRDIIGGVTGKASAVYLVLKQEFNKTIINLGDETHMRLRLK